MSRGFWRNVKVVAALHVAMVLLLGAGSWIAALASRPPEAIMPIEFVVAVPPAAPKSAPAPAPDPAPAPEPEPEPEPDTRPVARREIKVSRKRVTRTPRRAAAPTTLSAEEIRRLLDDGATPSDHTNVPDADARSLESIRRRLYGVWEQPSAAEAGAAVAEGRLRFHPDGSVISAELSKPSGNEVLDASVRHALRSVSRIEGLSASFLKRHPVVTVSFRVEG